jgi:hypothetical protein
MAAQIDKLMGQFERNQLAQYTLCSFKNRKEVVTALAEINYGNSAPETIEFFILSLIIRLLF